MIKSIHKTATKLDLYLRNVSIWSLFPIFFLIDFVYSYVTATIALKVDPSLVATPFDEMSQFKIFMITVIIAPIMETIIYQNIVMGLCYKFKVKSLYAVLVSSILFALAHSYNLTYIGIMLVPGFIFAYAYFIVREKRNVFRATLFVISLHAFSNLIAFFYNDIF